MADKWDGKGEPPKGTDLAKWLRDQSGGKIGIEQALADLRSHTRPGDKPGDAARRANADRKAQEKALNAPGPRLVGGVVVDSASTPTAVPAKDTNRDGKVSPTEKKQQAATADAAATDPNSIAAAIAAGPTADTTSDKGSPLWDFGTGLSDDTLNGLTVANRSKTKANPNVGTQIPARYRQADALAPMKWSEERRADLQKQLYSIGLYGDEKVQLGSWSYVDAGAMTELLTAANMNGYNWKDQIAIWQKAPPIALLEKIKGSTTAKQKPTIQVSNPIDIRASAAQVSQELTGGGDPGFIQSAAAAYQPQEIAAQQSYNADQEANAGGQVTQPPSMEQFLADKLRKEHPTEVAGKGFLDAFDAFAQLIGGSGA